LEKCDAFQQEILILNNKLSKSNEEYNLKNKDCQGLKNGLKVAQNSETSHVNNINLFKQLLSEAKAENDKLIISMSKNNDEINNLKSKLNDSEFKINQLQLNNHEYQEKIQFINDLLEVEKTTFKDKTLITQQEIRDIREEYTEKINIETNAHKLTTSNYHKNELDIKALEIKLISALEKVQRCKNELNLLMNENS